MEPRFVNEKTSYGRATYSALKAFREAILQGRYKYTEHAKARGDQRNISHGDVLDCVRQGEFCEVARRDGHITGAYFRSDLFVVVGSPSVPGTDFWKLEPVIVTVFRRDEEDDSWQQVPLVPRERVVERPLEEHSVDELEAALQRRRKLERVRTVEALAAQRAQLAKQIEEAEARLHQLSTERDAWASQAKQLEARLEAYA